MDLTKLHLHWRVGKRGKTEYRSYSLARAYREGGKNKKEIVVKLGKLSEGEAEQWRVTLRTAKNPNAILDNSSDTVSVISNRAYLDVAVALEVWSSWGLSEIFDSGDEKKQRNVPLSSLAAVLAINRCIDPSTKSKVPSWSKKTALPYLLNLQESEINPSRIFRELISIEESKDALTKHLCKKMTERCPEAMKSLFYDLSSTMFTGSRCILVKWGHCKEGYENHVVLALIVNTKGLPLYWEVLEGCTADVTTISWLLESLKSKLSIAIPTMVFDRGMVSDENLNLLEENNVKYITAMDKPQIEGIAKMDFTPFTKMTLEDVDSKIAERSDFICLDKNAYCKEVGVQGNRRYVLCFNPQLFKDQRKAREEQLVKLESFVKDENQALLQAKRNREENSTKKKFTSYLSKAKLKSFVSIKLKESSVMTLAKDSVNEVRSYEGMILVNKKKKQQAGRLDGFWLLVTNLSEKLEGQFIQDTRSVVQPYRDKVIIESSFRDVKSFIEIGPVHVWKPEHVKAHYTICVLSHLINRTLSLQLHEQAGTKTKEIISPESLYEECGKCQLNHLRTESGKEIHSLTKPTVQQKELLERLNMKHLIEGAMMQDLNSKALAKVTSK